MKYFVINIDDEEKIEYLGSNKPPIEWVDFQSGLDFINALFTDSNIQTIINNPEYIVLISIDEHLPWDNLSGTDVYSILGQYLQQFPTEVRKRIFPIGISSASYEQTYMPHSNRRDKSFFAKLYAPERNFNADNLENSCAIFTPEGYKDFRTGEIIPFSKKSTDLIESMKENYKEMKIN